MYLGSTPIVRLTRPQGTPTWGHTGLHLDEEGRRTRGLSLWHGDVVGDGVEKCQSCGRRRTVPQETTQTNTLGKDTSRYEGTVTHSGSSTGAHIRTHSYTHTPKR